MPAAAERRIPLALAAAQPMVGQGCVVEPGGHQRRGCHERVEDVLAATAATARDGNRGWRRRARAAYGGVAGGQVASRCPLVLSSRAQDEQRASVRQEGVDCPASAQTGRRRGPAKSWLAKITVPSGHPSGHPLPDPRSIGAPSAASCCPARHSLYPLQRTAGRPSEKQACTRDARLWQVIKVIKSIVPPRLWSLLPHSRPTSCPHARQPARCQSILDHGRLAVSPPRQQPAHV